MLLRQRRPTAFMATYMRCRHYICPSDAGDRFGLRGAAARPNVRNALVTLGKVTYIVLAGTEFRTLVYDVAPRALQNRWYALAAVAVCAMGGRPPMPASILCGRAAVLRNAYSGHTTVRVQAHMLHSRSNMQHIQAACASMQACALEGLSRDSWRHPPHRADQDQATSQRIVELAHERQRYGYRHIPDQLRAAPEDRLGQLLQVPR